jgi:type IV secretory pathway VirB4 component
VDRLQKLCENLSGQYVNLSLNEGIAINPFDLAPGETVPSSQKIKFLLGLIELMTKEDEQERLPRLERSEIEEAIQRLYDKSASRVSASYVMRCLPS